MLGQLHGKALRILLKAQKSKKSLFELAQVVEGEQTDWTIKSKALDGIFERYVDTPQNQQVAQTTTP
jgi:hypothetical protein